MRTTLAVLVALALLTAGCTGDSDDTGATTTVPAASDTTATTTVTTTGTSQVPSTSTPPAAVAVGLRPVEPFAAYAEIPLLTDSPPYAGPATPTSLQGVLWEEQVPEESRALLADSGFVVVESALGQFHEAYSNVDLTSRQPLFVTTDAAYHYWHLAFAKALRDTEQQVLLPILEQFALELNRVAEADMANLQGTAVAADAARVAAYSELLLAVLEMEDGPFPAGVTSELSLIGDHIGFETSPTTGAQVDYSLFVPRGHYTRTPELTRYFLAMSSLGQTAFKVAEPGQIRTGLLLARAIAGDPDLTRMWEQLYEPTAFLVGLADDYTPIEAVAAADRVEPGWQTSPDLLADDAVMAAVSQELLATRRVAIDPAESSVRVMGARFVLDSYILDQLVHPNVMGGKEVGRLEGSPLDVAAAFGSDWAHQRQVEAGIPAEFPDYDPQLDAMADLVAGRDIGDWATTVYDGWLYAIQPMWTEHGAAFPDVMQTQAWAAKAHNTGFGTYTELKHDTLLYAKQAFAEGEGPPPPPAEPRHWVEPEPVAYARLAAVAGLLEEGLGNRGLLSEDVSVVLEQLQSMYGRFADLATDELAGLPISTEDNEWLETIGSRFELLWLLAAEDRGAQDAATGGFAASPNDVAAVIADIMSNPAEALEIGTGYIDRIYVLVPNDDGQFQVARGGVYSYYEFWVPREERLTDEEWRQMLADGAVPDRPDWTQAFLVPQG